MGLFPQLFLLPRTTKQTTTQTVLWKVFVQGYPDPISSKGPVHFNNNCWRSVIVDGAVTDATNFGGKSSSFFW